jgi:hypothetical protein
MINYIKNAKQCFTDKNIKITKVCVLEPIEAVEISARTFHYIPDIKNNNTFYISINYFRRLKKNYYPYFGIPKSKGMYL